MADLNHPPGGKSIHRHGAEQAKEAMGNPFACAGHTKQESDYEQQDGADRNILEHQVLQMGEPGIEPEIHTVI